MRNPLVINDIRLAPEIDWESNTIHGIKTKKLTTGSNKSTYWIGKCGHKWQAVVYNRVRHNENCAVCANRQILAGYNDLLSQAPLIASERHPTLNGDLTFDKIGAGYSKKVWWLCSKCQHAWQGTPHKRVGQGTGCPKCSLIKSRQVFKQKHGKGSLGSEALKCKKEATCRKQWGVGSPMHVPSIATKAARNQVTYSSKIYWEDGSIMDCVSSYEPIICDYINANKIKVIWKPKALAIPLEVYKTPGGKPSEYNPDLFLVESGVYVEIKGRFYKDAEIKFNWLKSVYPNSELWDRTYITETLGLKLPKYQRKKPLADT